MSGIFGSRSSALSLEATESLLGEAVELAKAAGAITLEWFAKPGLSYDLKADGSEVSAADLATEQYLREQIEHRFSTDVVMGEEFGGEISPEQRTWIIDPIDGTRGFVRGVPLYATLLALVDNEGPLLGVINLPALGQTLAAGRGIGCWLGQHRCSVSSKAELKGALVNTSDFNTFRPEQFTQLRDAGAMLRTWGDAYGYFLVATGAAEAMIDPVCEVWDLAPVSVIISEAGGAFTDLAGNDSYTSRNGIASNGLLHQAVLASIAKP